MKSWPGPQRTALYATICTLAWYAASATAAPPPRDGFFVESDARAIRVLEGEEVGDYFGWVAAAVGDLNGDGVQDWIIPAIAEQEFTGRVKVFSGRDGSVLAVHTGQPGSALGFSVGAAGDPSGDGVPDYVVGGGNVGLYSGADHTLIFDVSATTGFGHSVAGAGDLNGDGIDDFAVGFQRFSEQVTDGGKVFALSGADGTLLWARAGDVEGGFYGSGLGAVGDVNGDGVSELVVGSFGADLAQVLDGTDGTVVHTLRPSDLEAATTFGQFFASGGGDVDCDGVGDVFVGDYNAGVGDAAGTGGAYAFSGRTGSLLFHLVGRRTGEGFGPGRIVADVNGDGHADVLVGAYTSPEGGEAAGKAYLFSGRSGALLRTITATRATDNFGVDALSVGDVDGDQLPDFLITAVGEAFPGTASGRAYIVAGTELSCAADLNHDRRVDVRDMWRVLRAWRDPNPPLAADLDGTGTVDLDDVLIVLRDLGRCPGGRPR